MNSHVEITGLYKSFGGRAAVRDLNLNMDEGELVSLLGPSGCGKTTTLRIIAGFEIPERGEVRIGNQNILALAPSRRNIGVVFQQYALFPHLNAWGNVAFGMKMARRPKREIETRVEELLNLVGLLELQSKFPVQMSGGQQQRVALARALATEPRLLLLDEPLSALDAVVRVSLRDEIRKIQTATGITTIYVTHDQEEALAISDRVVVMRDGSIEQIGTPEDIYSQPMTHFVASFIGNMNQLRATVTEAKAGRLQSGSVSISVPTDETRHLPDGATVTVLIRPEAISVSLPDSESHQRANTNHMSGRLSSVTFLGSFRRVGLQVNEHRLVADISATSQLPNVRDELVTIAFPSWSCRVLVDASSDKPTDKMPIPIEIHHPCD